MDTFARNALELARPKFVRRAAIAMVAASLSLFSLFVNAQAGESESSWQDPARVGSFDIEGVSVWFKDRFSEAELKTYKPEDFRVESHMCGCYDKPVPHYPYSLMFFSTPKGDLVGRPDRRGFDTIITRLAVRHGERYCDLVLVPKYS